MAKFIYHIVFLFFLAVGTPVFARDMYANEEIKIRQLLTDFVDGWNKHDPKLMASYWNADANFIDPSGKLATNQQEIEKIFAIDLKGRFAKAEFQQQIQFIEFLSSSIAFVDAEILIKGIEEKDPEERLKIHHAIYILNIKDGQWHIALARMYQSGQITRVQ